MGKLHRLLLVLACIAPWGAAHGAVLTMGAGGTYATLADAVAAAMAGDTIMVEPGTYTDQVATINVPLTIEGTGLPGQTIFTQSAAELPGLKGYLVTNANTTVANLTFQNASISVDNGANGAGIRQQAGNLTVVNSRFIGDQDGILATPATAGVDKLLIENSVFSENGVGSGPRAGFEHAIYAGVVGSLTVIGSTFEGTMIGHDVKSRAAMSTITGNYLDDGVTGTTSYAIDLTNGGVDVVSGNTINQGPNTDNNSMMTYSSEDPNDTTWAANSLLVSGNLFENSNYDALAINNFSSSVVPVISCNAFDDIPTITNGPATFSDNVINGGVPTCGSAVPEPPAVGAILAGLTLLGVVLVRRPRRRLVG